MLKPDKKGYQKKIIKIKIGVDSSTTTEILENKQKKPEWCCCDLKLNPRLEEKIKYIL